MRSLLPALAVALLSSAAHASDLELRLAFKGGDPVAVTLPDVKLGPQPSVVLHAADGSTMQFDLTFTHAADQPEDTYDLAMRIFYREVSGNYRIHEQVSEPMIRFKANKQAKIQERRVGPTRKSRQDGTDTGFILEALYRTEPATP